jgi:peptidoglycan/LPS O-acetylase OafA/YrhL
LFVHERVIALDSYPLAFAWAALFFLAMMGLGAVSWALVEKPPLRLRKPYLKKDEVVAGP